MLIFHTCYMMHHVLSSCYSVRSFFNSVMLSAQSLYCLPLCGFFSSRYCEQDTCLIWLLHCTRETSLIARFFLVIWVDLCNFASLGYCTFDELYCTIWSNIFCQTLVLKQQPSQNRGQTQATDRLPVGVSRIQRRYKNHWRQETPMKCQWWKGRTKHNGCAESIQSSLIRINLRKQCHVFSIYIDDFSTIILKRQDGEISWRHCREGCRSMMSHQAVVGQGLPMAECARRGGWFFRGRGDLPTKKVQVGN